MYCSSKSLEPVAIPLRQRPREDEDVGHGEVQALRAGCRDDVGCVAGEEEPAVLHRLDHEAAHGRDVLLDYRSVVQLPAVGGEAESELLPDPLVRPVFDVLGWIDLDVQAADRRRTQAGSAKPRSCRA